MEMSAGPTSVANSWRPPWPGIQSIQRQALEIMRTSNPALNEDVFANSAREYGQSTTMTLEGTAMKTGVLLAVLLAGVVYTWIQTGAAAPALAARAAAPGAAGMPIPQNAIMYMAAGAIGGLIFSLVTVVSPRLSPYSAPLYAGFEGLFIGGLSAMCEYMFPGIALQAAGLTLGTLVILLLAYSTRVISATENFKMGIVAATGAIGLVYLVSFILRLFGMQIPFIHESGMIGVGFSAFVVAIAALNLVLDFDFIENGARRGAPKYMEWYGGFGLLVTLVWLYIEVLRLLSKLRDRD
jgi:uncharacterized YccA/Bax inhibitor family protein